MSPLSTAAVPSFGEVVVSANLQFDDGSTCAGAITATMTRGGIGYSSPILFLGNQRIDVPDGWPQFDFGGVSHSYTVMSDSLRERLEREFLQQRARTERHLGKVLRDVFPAKFELASALREGVIITGTLPYPGFHVPIGLGESMEVNNDILRVTRELGDCGGRWIVAVASAYADPNVMFEAVSSAVRRWCASRVDRVQRVDLLLLARELDPDLEGVLHHLASRWNKARMPEGLSAVEVCLGSREETWSVLTNVHSKGASPSTKVIVFPAEEAP